MSFSNILRRVASSIAPLAKRTITSQRNYSTAILTPLKTTTLSHQFFPKTTFVFSFHLSSLSEKRDFDRSLLQVIDTEIKCEEDDGDKHQLDEPEGFPFEIQDNLGKGTITLRREHHGEIIQAEVHLPDALDEDEDSVDDEEGSKSSLSFVVRVLNGSGKCLEFGCVAYPDEIEIDRLIVRNEDASEDDLTYEGPAVTDLDESLQEALHKYLEIRGITPSVTNFLHECMISKDSNEYLLWLKNLRKFISHGASR